MTKHDLKELAAIGAELGAAKAENDRLRGLLEAALYYVPSNKTELRALIDAALSQQAEPTDTFIAVDMATAAAQGFRDGQAAVEPAPAQDEREAVSSYSAPSCEDGYGFGYVDGTCIQSLRGYRDHLEAIIDSIPGEPMMPVAQHERIVAALTRPAQTEQQPWDDSMVRDFLSVALRHVEVKGTLHSQDIRDALRYMAKLYAAPIAQTAPQPEQSGLEGLLRQVTDELDALNCAYRDMVDECAEPDEEPERCDATDELIARARAALSTKPET